MENGTFAPCLQKCGNAEDATTPKRHHLRMTFVMHEAFRDTVDGGW
jgi:hypothetical protein